MYDRILVPLDGSAEAEASLAHAVELARKFGSALHLLQVTTPAYQAMKESVAATAPEVGIDLARRRLDAEQTASREYLQSVAAHISSDGIRVAFDVVEGTAATAILEYVSKHDISLIAMTTHGRGGLGRLIFGSVADAVLRNSPVPVLLVRVRA